MHGSLTSKRILLLLLFAGTVPARPAAAASAPDGYVLWQSNRLDARNEVYRARADGSEVTRMTQTGGLLPAWAPDGRWIAFHDDAGTGYLMRPDGSERKTLDGISTGFWLHDNSGIAVTQAGLWYVLDPETLKTTPLIRPEDYPQFAGASLLPNSLTHDNRYLLAGTSLYMNGYTGTNGSFTSAFSAVIVDLLHKDKIYFFGSGCWPTSPPAGDLVYHVCGDCPSHPDLYRMNLTDLATRSSYAPEVAHEDPDWGHEYNPRVSNDNQWLAYMASAGCHDGASCDYDVWLHQLGTAPSERLRVTEDPSFDGYPQLFVGPLWQKTSQPRLLLTPWKITFFASADAMPAAQAISMKNSGGGTLGAVSVTTDPAAPWLDAAYDGTGSISVAVRGGAIRRGTSQATVTVTVDGALGSPALVPVTLNADESFPNPDGGVPAILGMDASTEGDFSPAIDAPAIDAPVVDAAIVDAPITAGGPDVTVQSAPSFDAMAADNSASSETAPAKTDGGCACALGGVPAASPLPSLFMLAFVAWTVHRRRR
jgi:MYXO-CTERM domain-containing protein